ncbi:MAG TPA: ELWxxDGT repeat protein [Thermoanaerobaculia bacterium]
MSRAACLTLLLVLLPAAASRAEPAPATARLVADIRPLPLPPASGRPHELTAGRDLLFFAADDGFAGFELWATEGTPGRAYRVADVCPGPCSSSPRQITAAGKLVYFLARDPAHGEELWRSDGTSAGTFLLADLAPGASWGGLSVTPLVAAGSRVFLVATRVAGQTARQELWTSDGTPRGTARLAELPAMTLLAPVGGRMLFVGFDASHGQELWRSDGTPAGTRLLRDIARGPTSALSAGELNVTFAVLDGRLYFPAFDEAHGVELWQSDGTAAGTRLVRDIVPGPGSSLPFYLRAAGSRLFFTAEVAAGRRLWRSDGTAQGTRLVGGPAGIPIFALGDAVLLLVEDPAASEKELWIAGGAGGARRLLSLPVWHQFGRFASLGEEVVFLFGGDELEIWKTDGTPAGTAPVTGIEGAFAFDLVAFRGFAYFTGSAPGQGDELWRSDGTAGGTGEFADLHSGDRSSSPLSLLDLNGTLLFTADDGSHGREVWRSDGTRAGTALVAELVPPGGEEIRQSPTVLGRAGGALLFATPDGALRRTMGVPGDPVLLRGGLGFVKPARVAGPLVFFFSAVQDDSQGYSEWVVSLWRSDGTAAGTIALAEVARGETDFQHGPLAPPTPRFLAVAGNDLYFLADGLWRSDGTPAGTARLFDDPCAGACDSTFELAAVGETLFFGNLAFDLDTQRARNEVWRSDGTAAGTFPLRAVLEVSLAEHGANADGFALRTFTPAGDRLFFVADDAVHGAELWVSDGTAAGTRMVRDLRPGPAGSHPAWLTAKGEGVFFAADGGVRGQELWWSDGSGPGTRPVRDIAPGAASSFPQELAVIEGQLLFAAFDPEHGLEVWRSDGTAAGTRLLADAFPGPGSSAPRSFTRAGGTLFFVAGRPRPGYELFRMSLGGPF